MISVVTSEEEDRAPTPNNSTNKNMNTKVYNKMGQWSFKTRTTTTTTKKTKQNKKNKNNNKKSLYYSLY